jgi:glutathione synthase/RimK-type ligase-like ATP-grasp enzyme
MRRRGPRRRGLAINGVFVTSDKALLYKNLEAQEVRNLKTLVSRYEEGLKTIERALATSGKVVVKPADGDGCAGLSLASKPEEASLALSIAKQNSRLLFCPRVHRGREPERLPTGVR